MLTISTSDLPDYFYKYRSLHSEADRRWAEDIVANSRLWWPSPLDFNDPFDCVPVHQYVGSARDKERAAREVIRRMMKNSSRYDRRKALKETRNRREGDVVRIMNESNRLLLERSSVCSLSELGDNVLMWSHYADAHRGICFRFRPLAKDADSLDPHRLGFEFALPVTYSKQRPVVDLMLDDFGPGDLIEKVLLTKADFWSYEREWRMIGHEVSKGARTFPPRSLDAIILGSRIAREHEDLVRSWVERYNPKPKLLRAVSDERDFRVNIGPA